jgi:dihydroflavonol-4-reductase
VRIAVIGASGMLGRHTALAVRRRGHDLVAVYRTLDATQALQGADIDVRQADLRTPASLRSALAGVDAVINCAAYYPGAPRPWREEVAAAMHGFYEVCAGLALSKVVYLGAAIALPTDPSGQPANEAASYPGEPKDKNPYLQVKWALDEQARAWADRGLPVSIGIPTMSFGEFDPGNSMAASPPRFDSLPARCLSVEF